jgi:pimeloyl-ACP methyl ester carboxylesterase
MCSAGCGRQYCSGWLSGLIIQARRQLRSRGARWLLYPVLGVLMLASVGGGYETVGEYLDARMYRMPGQLVDVGGHRLHLYCHGSGSPTVVLEPGLGGASSDLGWVAPAVARDSRVCVYDRAGRGWSDAADGPQDAARIAADLHTLLDRAQVPGPYVLAGHSFGGLYVQTFAATYPDQVAGLVLLDSTAPKPGPALPTRAESYSVLDRVSAVFSAVAHLGAGQLIAQASYGSLPPHFRGEARANASTARYLRSYIEEFVEANTSMQQAASLTNLKGKPLIVLTADTGKRRWMAAGAGPHGHTVDQQFPPCRQGHHPRIAAVRRNRLRTSQSGHPRRHRRGTDRPTTRLAMRWSDRGARRDRQVVPFPQRESNPPSPSWAGRPASTRGGASPLT